MMVKICGITNREDARAAGEGGASAIGFNFWPRSPRYIAPEAAAGIGAGSPVWRVGVFVNETPERIQEIAGIAGLDIVQLHGDETPERYPRDIRVWKAVRVTPELSLESFDGSGIDALLLDGPAGALYGGSGLSFDWSKAARAAQRIVIAGGLDASNVRQAIQLARPWGVDACSRLESAPGRKDPRKLMEFLKAARS